MRSDIGAAVEVDDTLDKFRQRNRHDASG